MGLHGLIGQMMSDEGVTSNGSYVDFDCDSFFSPYNWLNLDQGNGVSSVVGEGFNLFGGAIYNRDNTAARGTNESTLPTSDTVTSTFIVETTNMEASPANSRFLIHRFNSISDGRLILWLSSDSLKVYNGSAYIGHNGTFNNSEDIKITSVINNALTPASAIVDIYVNNVFFHTFDCSATGPDNNIRVYQSGATGPGGFVQSTMLVKSIKIGDGLG